MGVPRSSSSWRLSFVVASAAFAMATALLGSCLDDLTGSYCLPDGGCGAGYYCDQAWDSRNAAPGRCRAGTPPELTDAGSTDAGNDGGLIDAGTDAGVDGGLDAGLDAGIDAGVHAGPPFDPRCDGGVITYSTNAYFPDEIVINGGRFFWAEREDNVIGSSSSGGAIYSGDVCGGVFSSVTSAADPIGLAQAGDDLFFTTIGDNAVYRVQMDGGDRTQLQLPQQNGTNDPIRIVVSGDNVYWINVDVWPKIQFAPRDGGVGSATVLVDDAGTATDGIGGLTTDGTSVFWADGTMLMRAPLDGGTPQCVATTAQQLIADLLAVDGRVYVATDTGFVQVADANSTSCAMAATIMDAGQTSPTFTKIRGLARGGPYLYWSVLPPSGQAQIYRMNLDAGTPFEAIGGPQGVIVHLAAEGNRVFWTRDNTSNHMQGTVQSEYFP